MALAVGSRVYLDVNGGIMSDPPLFGVVDYIDGSGKDVVRVCWENGATQFFASVADAESRLVVVADDPAESVVSLPMWIRPRQGEAKVRVIVLRTWVTGVRRALISRGRGHYLIVDFSELEAAEDS